MEEFTEQDIKEMSEFFGWDREMTEEEDMCCYIDSLKREFPTSWIEPNPKSIH